MIANANIVQLAGALSYSSLSLISTPGPRQYWPTHAKSPPQLGIAWACAAAHDLPMHSFTPDPGWLRSYTARTNRHTAPDHDLAGAPDVGWQRPGGARRQLYSPQQRRSHKMLGATVRRRRQLPLGYRADRSR